MKEYVAILMSGDHEKWFNTEKEAWDYIYSRRCKECQENPEWDMCSAEWDVWTREEYLELTEE